MVGGESLVNVTVISLPHQPYPALPSCILYLLPKLFAQLGLLPVVFSILLLAPSSLGFLLQVLHPFSETSDVHLLCLQSEFPEYGLQMELTFKNLTPPFEVWKHVKLALSPDSLAL